MKEKSRFASFLFHLGLTSLFRQALSKKTPPLALKAKRRGRNREEAESCRKKL